MFASVVLPQASSSTYNVMKRIVAESGIQGLFAGKSFQGIDYYTKLKI